MKQIVNNWINFCNDNTLFHEDDFYTLFMGDISVEEIEAIFKPFPNSDKLTTRMKDYLFGEKLIIDNDLKKLTLDKFIKNDFEEKESILKTLPSFSNFNSNHSFTYIEDINNMSDLLLNDILTQDFHDFMFSQMIITDKKAYELSNAFYGATFDFDYQLFLLQPLLNTNYTMKYLYNFKKLGGVYALTDNEVFYSFK